MRSGILIVLVLCLLIPGHRADAQQSPLDRVHIPDSAHVQVLRLVDGTTLVGRFTVVGADSLAFETATGRLWLHRASVVKVVDVPSASIRAGRYWHPDPDPTRLFAGPTARTLPKGQGDFSDTYLFLLSAGYGVTDWLQVGGGLSVFPTGNFGDNVFFGTAKLALIRTPHANIAVGGIFGSVGLLRDDAEHTGLPYLDFVVRF